MTGLTSKNIEELQALMAELGEPKFRARQVFEWLSRGVRPGEMTNLSKSLREKLAALPYGGGQPFIRNAFLQRMVRSNTCSRWKTEIWLKEC